MHLKLLLFFTFLANLCFAQLDVDHWETAVFAEDTWNYRIGNSEPPSNWMEPAFNDSSWPTGTGGFGYGDGDDNTTIGQAISVYLRIDFNVIDLSNIEMAVLHADYDDAFVAYLNGEEFARGNFDNVGANPPFDATPLTDHEAALFNGGLPEAFAIYADNFENLIQAGQNTLAIQVHNFNINSSDLSSNFFLSLGIKDNSTNYDPVPFWFYEPFVATDLPLVKIKTDGQTIVDEPKIVADLEIIDNGPGNLNYITDAPNDYDGKIAIEIRGASSQFFPKNNYGFETQDEFGENNNVSLLGMPEENDWILHGPFSDKSLIRNALTFDLGRKMMDYASRTKFCELMINDDYRGVYLMMERIKRDTFRVDISKLRPEDIEGDELTGGYIIQIDRDDDSTEEDGWYSPHGSSPFYAYHRPKYDDLLPVQKDYIRDWMTDFEFQMTLPNYDVLYDDYIDVESFIDYFLISELTKHIDAFKLSFYMYKRKDSNGGKLHMGPIWDFNLGYSNFTFECDPDPQGWIYPCTSRAFWLNKILDIPEVQDQMHCRWEELREDILNTNNLMNNIDGMADELASAQQRNFSRWPILGLEVWPNFFVGPTYESEIDFLKDWLTDRVNWMDQNMLGAPNNCIVSTDYFSDAIDIEASPNPFDAQIIFTYKNERFETGELLIFDAIGNKVEEQFIQANASFSWDTNHLSTGIYFYKLKVGDAFKTGKIIKQ